MSRYVSLSREELESRLQAFENNVAGPSTYARTPQSYLTGASYAPTAGVIKQGHPSKDHRKKAKQAKQFNFHSYPTRHIALLVAYQGWPYSGLAIQPLLPDSQPTVEGELLRALEKTRLIEAGKGWDGCGFSRCGRTDAGVSGSGQVVNLWVRSNRLTPPASRASESTSPGEGVEWWREPRDPAPPKPLKEDTNMDDADTAMEDVKFSGKIKALDKGKQVERPEFAYPRTLNGVLPPSIRVLAWCPVPSTFDSRFSCKYRHYKYAFNLKPSPTSPPLELEAMKEACQFLLGEHDFRNFCKIDGSKQIENHNRTVVKAYFEDLGNGQIIFNLIGSAFLWHQVRHIMGILFLVGSKLEKPEVVTELLDVEKCPSRPSYSMANALPLRLHECGYQEEEVDWRVGSYDGPMNSLSETERAVEMKERNKLISSLEEARQEAEIRTWQIAGSLQRFTEIFPSSGSTTGSSQINDGVTGGKGDGKIQVSHPIGAGEIVGIGNYKPVMTRSRGETPDVVNQKWREGKGRLRQEKKDKESMEE